MFEYDRGWLVGQWYRAAKGIINLMSKNRGREVIIILVMEFHHMQVHKLRVYRTQRTLFEVKKWRLGIAVRSRFLSFELNFQVAPALVWRSWVMVPPDV